MFQEVVDFIRAQFKTDEPIYLHEPLFVGNEKKYLIDAIDSTYVSSIGRYVDLFEKNIKEYTGAHYAISVVNGTAALHMGLILAGVKRDDYVLTQPLSFIATCNAISYIGAEPVFIDIDQNTLGLSAEKLKKFCDEKTIMRNGECFMKADGRRIAGCVPMHTFGLASEIDAIIDVCNVFGIPLIEDAAESLGTTYKGKHTGTFGLLGTYSFNGNKTITCGGGGVIVTNDERLGKMAKHLTTQAKVPHPWNFVHDHIGYNYRLPNLNAALACAQMEQLDIYIEKKRDLHMKYKTFFANTTTTLVTETEYTKSNYWLNAILLADKKERDDFLKYTNEQKVMTRPSWALMTELEMFKNSPKGDITNAEWVSDRLVNLPSSVLF